MERERIYVCIDLKSFYASVECRERGLDPMTTKLVVADPERSEKTICLAVSPALKKLGIPGRCRVFEIPEGISYMMAPPRMQLYIDYSAEIYGIYLKYIAKEDIHVYSVDEVFMDVTDYLTMYELSARELSVRIMEDIYETTGITATCGIGTNLYLAKVALDIISKHAQDCIGELTEETYRECLWRHQPLTDFWRVGSGVERRLRSMGIFTMEGVAKADEEALYRMFGVDAELLIDHAWGRETTQMSDIKSYKAKTNSISSGQVLACDYPFEDGRLAAKEMAELLCLELVEKNLVTGSITLDVHYSRRSEKKPTHGTISLSMMTSSARMIRSHTEKLYDQIVNPFIPVRKLNLTFNHVMDEAYQQYDLFVDPAELEREKQIQKAVLDIKDKYGKNAILKGMNLQKGATTRERNGQIGGHKSGEI